MSKEAFVELKHVNKKYGNYEASKDISFSIEKGNLVGLLGPSGSGKTTILKIIAGLEEADSGEIYIDGREVNHVKPSERGIGFVFQNYALFRYKTVAENIGYALQINHWSKGEIRDRVEELTKLVGLEGLENRYPRQLSGGQRQRVAFARAIAIQPELLLLDEPFAAIDAKVRKELRIWLKDLIHQVGITSIFVTHDQDEATEVADQIIVTNQGRIEQIGAPLDIYSKPNSSFVAQFLGESVKVQNYRELKGFQHLTEGDTAIIRPEYLVVSKQGELQQYSITSEEGIVEHSIFRGSFLELHVKVRGVTLIAHRPISQDLISEGEKVSVFIRKLNVVNGEAAETVPNRALEERGIYVI